MNTFDYHYPVRQHFGKGCAEEAICSEMKSVGTRVLLAYGGSLKRTGRYDKIRSWLDECGKQVTNFGGIKRTRRCCAPRQTPASSRPAAAGKCRATRYSGFCGAACKAKSFRKFGVL